MAKKRKEGRPTDYKPEYNEQAEKLCKLGATDKDLADSFNVTETTINNWKISYPQFFESIKKGKEIADMEVANSLYKRAIGYEVDDEEVKVVSCGGNMGSEVVKVPIRKKYPPDPTSMIFWLKNRKSTLWRDRHDIEANVKHTTLPEGLTKEDLLKYAKWHEGK